MIPPFTTHIANFVFKLCRPGAKEIPSLPAGDNAISQIVSFAARNGVAPWCFYRLNQFGTHKNSSFSLLVQDFKKHYLQTLVMNQQRWQVFQEIKRLLDTHQIEVIPLKGLALAFTLYPQEALRPMGDIDLLIHPEKVYRARNILIDHGAKPLHVALSKAHEQVHAHVAALSWKGIMVEPHQRLFALGSPLNPEKIALFDQLIKVPGNSFRIFNEVMMTYHLAAHVIKGYKMGGMRFSWLLDLALMLQRNMHDPDFKSKVIDLHQPAAKDIESVLTWASMLLSDQPEPEQKAATPFPKEKYFHREHHTKQRHKWMVLHEILHLPAFGLKAKILFRELFPAKSYMERQYGKSNSSQMGWLYLKRLFGRASK